MSGQALSTEELLRSQATEIIHLTKENRILKAALTRQTIEAGKSFREMQDQFDELAKQIYDVICHWVAVLQRALTYDEIIEKYRKRYPSPPYVNYTAETITRRVRELAEDGWLHSPERGTFVPVKKEEAQT
jgi:hypothetical protein